MKEIIIACIEKLKDLPFLPRSGKDWPIFLSKRAYAKGRPAPVKELVKAIQGIPEDSDMSELSDEHLKCLLCCLISHAEEAFFLAPNEPDPDWEAFASLVESDANKMIDSKKT